jgi:hypothetical protein
MTEHERTDKRRRPEPPDAIDDPTSSDLPKPAEPSRGDDEDRSVWTREGADAPDAADIEDPEHQW